MEDLGQIPYSSDRARQRQISRTRRRRQRRSKGVTVARRRASTRARADIAVFGWDSQRASLAGSSRDGGRLGVEENDVHIVNPSDQTIQRIEKEPVDQPYVKTEPEMLESQAQPPVDLLSHEEEKIRSTRKKESNKHVAVTIPPRRKSYPKSLRVASGSSHAGRQVWHERHKTHRISDATRTIIDKKVTTPPVAEPLKSLSIVSSTTPSLKSFSRTSSQRKVLRRFVRELERYIAARQNAKVVPVTPSPSQISMSQVSAYTIRELLPYVAEFRAADLAVTSREQLRMKDSGDLAHGAAANFAIGNQTDGIDVENVIPWEVQDKPRKEILQASSEGSTVIVWTPRQNTRTLEKMVPQPTTKVKSPRKLLPWLRKSQQVSKPPKPLPKISRASTTATTIIDFEPHPNDAAEESEGDVIVQLEAPQIDVNWTAMNFNPQSGVTISQRIDNATGFPEIGPSVAGRSQTLPASTISKSRDRTSTLPATRGRLPDQRSSSIVKSTIVENTYHYSQPQSSQFIEPPRRKSSTKAKRARMSRVDPRVSVRRIPTAERPTQAEMSKALPAVPRRDYHTPPSLAIRTTPRVSKAYTVASGKALLSPSVYSQGDDEKDIYTTGTALEDVPTTTRLVVINGPVSPEGRSTAVSEGQSKTVPRPAKAEIGEFTIEPHLDVTPIHASHRDHSTPIQSTLDNASPPPRIRLTTTLPVVENLPPPTRPPPPPIPTTPPSSLPKIALSPAAPQDLISDTAVLHGLLVAVAAACDTSIHTHVESETGLRIRRFLADLSLQQDLVVGRENSEGTDPRHHRHRNRHHEQANPRPVDAGHTDGRGSVDGRGSERYRHGRNDDLAHTRVHGESGRGAAQCGPDTKPANALHHEKREAAQRRRRMKEKGKGKERVIDG